MGRRRKSKRTVIRRNEGRRELRIKVSDQRAPRSALTKIAAKTPVIKKPVRRVLQVENTVRKTKERVRVAAKADLRQVFKNTRNTRVQGRQTEVIESFEPEKIKRRQTALNIVSAVRDHLCAKRPSTFKSGSGSGRIKFRPWCKR